MEKRVSFLNIPNFYKLYIILDKLDYLRDIIAISEEVCKLSIDIIKTNFFQDLHLDNIQILEILSEIEFRYDLIIPDEIAENMDDLKDISSYIYIERKELGC